MGKRKVVNKNDSLATTNPEPEKEQVRNKKNTPEQTTVRYYRPEEITLERIAQDFFPEEIPNLIEKGIFPETEDGMMDFSCVSLEYMKSGKCSAMIAEAIRREREEGAMTYIGEEDINTPEEVSWEMNEKALILMEAWEKAEEEAGEA